MLHILYINKTIIISTIPLIFPSGNYLNLNSDRKLQKFINLSCNKNDHHRRLFSIGMRVQCEKKNQKTHIHYTIITIKSRALQNTVIYG